MNQVYCRVLAALVVAAALAACGASDDEPQRVANDGDLATYGVESLFSVGVPSDWRTLTADEVFTDEVLETIREANPELGPTLDAIAAPGSPMEAVRGRPRSRRRHLDVHERGRRPGRSRRCDA
jgi:hypothetical protein